MELRYLHRPLPDPTQYIRLITSVDVDETRAIPVHCQLETWSLTQAPAYHAISYTWGDPSLTALILVNGRPFECLKNCEYVLKQARWHEGAKYYWCDALCIAQADKEEKSSQVAMMGRLFEEAELVLACLGPHADDSKYLYRVLGTSGNMLDDIPASRPGTKIVRYGSYEANTPRKAVSWAWRRFFRLPRIYKALARLSQRPYFTRLWVYQELSLARRVILMCGESGLPISKFHALASMLESWNYIGFLSAQTESWILGPLPWGTDKRAIRQLNFPSFVENHAPSVALANKLLFAGAFPGPVKTHLETVVESLWHLKCQEPCDKIYGLISVIKWEDLTPIQTDYSRDRFELALDVASTINHERLKNTARPDSDSEFVVLSCIAQSLGLVDHPTMRLDQAVESRRSKMTFSPKASPYPCHWISHSFLGGLQLECEGSQWRFSSRERLSSDSNYASQPKIHHGIDGKDLQTIKCNRDEQIILPCGTKSGDFCLFIPEWPVSTLIIRQEGTTERFSIVGKALRLGDRQHNISTDYLGYSLDEFALSLDIEDALILAYSEVKCQDAKYYSSTAMSEFLNTRVCSHTGSSEARRFVVAYNPDCIPLTPSGSIPRYPSTDASTHSNSSISS